MFISPAMRRRLFPNGFICQGKANLKALDSVHRAHGKGGITVETLEVESFNTSEVLS